MPYCSLIFSAPFLEPQVCRQWVYYRLMEHGVLLDFKTREKTDKLYKSHMDWLLLIGGITTFVQFGNVGISEAYYAQGYRATAAELFTLLVS